MAGTVSKEVENEYKAIFSMLGTKGGIIPADQLAGAMRLAHQNPTNRDVQQILSDMKKTSVTSTIDFNEFCSIMKQYSKSRVEMEEQLVSAFRTFDRLQCGLVFKEELRRILLTLGDALDEKEFDELCKEATVDPEGRINYQIFARLLLA